MAVDHLLTVAAMDVGLSPRLGIDGSLQAMGRIRRRIDSRLTVRHDPDVGKSGRLNDEA
jgi:hypothetical protein